MLSQTALLRNNSIRTWVVLTCAMKKSPTAKVHPLLMNPIQTYNRPDIIGRWRNIWVCRLILLMIFSLTRSGIWKPEIEKRQKRWEAKVYLMNILSFNVRGLGRGVKWYAIRRLVRKHRVDLLCL